KILYQIEENFDFVEPSRHLPQLIAAYKALMKVTDRHWRSIKLRELEDIILAVCGLYLEASAAVPNTYPGGTVAVQIEAINRSDSPILLRKVSLSDESGSDMAIPLKENKRELIQLNLKIPENTPYTNPYWLNQKWDMGMYKVDDQELIGSPETPVPFMATFELEFDGFPIKINKPLVYRYSRPDKGELYQPFAILPEATAGFKDKVIVFSNGEPKEIPVTIKAHKNNIEGEVQLNFGKGWQVDREIRPFKIAKKGDQQIIRFLLTPPTTENEDHISQTIRIAGKEITKELIEIDYDHVPKQSVLLPSESKVVRLNIEKVGDQIGYINGAGDEI